MLCGWSDFIHTWRFRKRLCTVGVYRTSRRRVRLSHKLKNTLLRTYGNILFRVVEPQKHPTSACNRYHIFEKRVFNLSQFLFLAKMNRIEELIGELRDLTRKGRLVTEELVEENRRVRELMKQISSPYIEVRIRQARSSSPEPTSRQDKGTDEGVLQQGKWSLNILFWLIEYISILSNSL